MEDYKKFGLVSLEESNKHFADQGPEYAYIEALSEALCSIVGSLSDRRIALGMSQRDIAAVLGVKQPAVARFELLEVVPRLDTVIKYAMAVGATIEVKFNDAPSDGKSSVEAATK